MKLGEKIRYFRRKKELTQKKLGILLGFSESNADTRISQYEAGIRKPSYFVLQNLSHQLDVAMHTLEAPDIDLQQKPLEAMHILFALEDAGLIHFTDSGIFIATADKKFRKRLLEWAKMHTELPDAESYNNWRYRYEK